MPNRGGVGGVGEPVGESTAGTAARRAADARSEKDLAYPTGSVSSLCARKGTLAIRATTCSKHIESARTSPFDQLLDANTVRYESSRPSSGSDFYLWAGRRDDRPQTEHDAHPDGSVIDPPQRSEIAG